MNIEELTIKQVREIQNLFPVNNAPVVPQASGGLSSLVGRKVIVRTYSAGVWYGELIEKSGTEVILRNARRMFQWWAAKSISLSGVAVYGIKHDKSKICGPVSKVWMDAIEILSPTEEAMASIESAPEVEAV